MRTVLIAFFLIAGSTAVTAQTLEFSGQFRERSELNDKSFNEGTHRDVYHLLRTRLQAVGTVNDQVRVVLELQDARLFGEESSTFNSGAPHFDLRQGFVRVSDLAGGALTATLGRQALVYANQRFIGAIDWHNYGQTFDAGVLRLQRGEPSAWIAVEDA
ncbi:MAG: alginate export family protein, partial [Bacteroidota bacterium]|nr:alginate export family protein [Bacteroidota bacterium]